MSGYTTAAGSELAISAGSPASQDEAGFEALAFTAIGGTEQIGAFGATFETVNFQPLKGALQKLKGPPNYGALSPAIGVDEADAGQALLRTAGEDESQKLYAFRATKPNGAIRYFQGRVFGLPEGGQGAASVEMLNPAIEICTKPIRVAAPTT